MEEIVMVIWALLNLRVDEFYQCKMFQTLKGPETSRATLGMEGCWKGFEVAPVWRTTPSEEIPIESLLRRSNV